MTDPQNPAEQPAAAPTPPPSPEPSAPAPEPAPAYGTTPPPAYGTTPPPAYAPAPPAAYGAPAPGAPVPGKTMGIVAFVLSFFVQLIALILGIIALVQSKKAGASNGFAVAAIIISAVLMVIGIIVGIVLVSLFGYGFSMVCGELGSGTHVLDTGGVITCP